MTDRLPLTDDLLVRMLDRRSARGDSTGLASESRAAVEATSQRVLGGPRAFFAVAVGQPFGSSRNSRMAAYATAAVVATAAIVLAATGVLPGTVPGGIAPSVSPSASEGPSPTEEPTPTPDPIDRSSRDVGYIGLPPPGAIPSDPERADLVESFYHPGGPPYRGAIFIYADGRMIWNEYFPTGQGRSTGWLEQRLTPEGIDLVQGLGIQTSEHDVPRRLDPAALPNELPASAWAEITVRPYVPSGFAACVFVSDWEGAGEAPSATLSELLLMLPVGATDLLRDRTPVTAPEEFEDPEPSDCLGMNLADARRLDAAFREAGLEQDGWRNLYLLEYHIDLDGDGPETRWLNVWFEPILPDGTIHCSSCG